MMSSTSPTRFSLIFSMIQAARSGLSKVDCVKRGSDEGRADRVDADTLLAPFDRHRFDHAFKPVLGRTIKRPIDTADMAHLA